MNDNKIILIIFYGIILLAIAIFFIGTCVIGYMNPQELEIIIKDKYVKGQAGTYMVIDENQNAYVIQDLFFKGKFNSTDLYSQLKIDQKYKIKTTGYRIHIISEYPNINEIEEVSEN